MTEARRPPGHAPAALRVLIVEDNPADAELVDVALEDVARREFLTTTAGGLQEALALTARHRYDVLLVDIGLPDASGSEAVKALQAAAPSVPMVVLSGREDDGFALELIEHGAQDYLLKNELEPRRLGRVIDYAISRKRAELALESLAQHDPLTGAANRRMFDDRLEHALARARRSGHGLALLYLDMDGFKPVNDRYGHIAGDSLLCEVADRLRELLREADTVARLGGDEFVALVEEIGGRRHAAAVAGKVLEALSRPFDLEVTQVQVGVSIGVAVYPESARDPAGLLRCADAAMYQVKRNGRNGLQVYGDGETTAGEQEDHAQAMRVEDLGIVYLPQLELASGAVAGMEALLRWQRRDDRGELALHDGLAGVAERSGRVVTVESWVLRHACEQARRWHADGRPLQVAANVSVRRLQEEGFAEFVAATLAEAGLADGSLELEFAESELVRDTARCRPLLDTLKAAGVRLAVDGFGAGYAALNCLRTLPLDTVKLDRSFACQLHEPGERAVLRALVDGAHALGMRVVAEGVDETPQLEALQGLDLDLVQGRVVAWPLYELGEAAASDAPA